jgi:DnaJ-class molecular chaperone
MMAGTESSTAEPNFYDILQITSEFLDSSSDPAQALKRAYHRALLIHHPDKKSQAQTRGPREPEPSPASVPTYTVDQISTAFAVLSDGSRRAAYDKTLRGARWGSGQAQAAEFQTGIEDVDLDDLDLDSDMDQWYRGCRCGNPRGYRVREADLEEAADYGEVMVGCQDCSLWLRVRFAVVDDGDTSTDMGIVAS